MFVRGSGYYPEPFVLLYDSKEPEGYPFVILTPTTLKALLPSTGSDKMSRGPLKRLLHIGSDAITITFCGRSQSACDTMPRLRHSKGLRHAREIISLPSDHEYQDAIAIALSLPLKPEV